MKFTARFWLLNILLIAVLVTARKFHLGGSEVVALGIVIGADLDFGIPTDEASLTTQRVSMTGQVDVKTARDKDGIEIAASLYNQTQDIMVEGLGTTNLQPAATLSLTTPPIDLVGSAAYILSATVDTENEAFVKSSIRAKCWEGI